MLAGLLLVAGNHAGLVKTFQEPVIPGDMEGDGWRRRTFATACETASEEEKRQSTRLAQLDHLGREDPANQRNLTGVSPELMLEWVMVWSGRIMYAMPGGWTRSCLPIKARLVPSMATQISSCPGLCGCGSPICMGLMVTVMRSPIIARPSARENRSRTICAQWPEAPGRV